MNIQAINLKKTTIVGLTDILVLGLFYIASSLSHMFYIPFYVLDPMRLFVFILIISTNKTNAVLMAITLPYFSFLTSGHPLFPKFMIISIELSSNVILYHFFLQYLKNTTLSGALSIAVSKLLYYVIKYIMIILGIFGGSLITTSINYQIISLIIIGILLYVFRNHNQRIEN